MRKKARFHSLKKLVSYNGVSDASMPGASLTLCPENQTRLVTLVIIQYCKIKATVLHHQNIFPAEMGRQVRYTCLSRRADTGEEVEAHVQEKPPCGRPNGSQILG
jgi:hypothetical protein